MPKPQEIFWEVGKELSQDKWVLGEFVRSPKFPITEACSLQVYFYPEGLGDDKRHIFKRVRSNTDEWMNIKGDIQLCHGTTIAKWYILDDVFRKGEDCATYGLEDIPKLAKFRIFHSLPDLCYRLVFTVSTDEKAYAKRSSDLQSQSPSVPREEGLVQQHESSQLEATDYVQQTESSDAESDSKQAQSSDPEADSKQAQSSDPEADSKQAQSSDPEADSKQVQSSDPEADSKQAQSSDPEEDGDKQAEFPKLKGADSAEYDEVSATEADPAKPTQSSQPFEQADSKR